MFIYKGSETRHFSYITSWIMHLINIIFKAVAALFVYLSEENNILANNIYWINDEFSNHLKNIYKTFIILTIP